MGKPPLPRLNDPSGGLPNAGPAPSPYPLLNLIFDYPDNVDATHPLNLDYFVPANLKQLVTARLSFRLRAFRSYEVGIASATTAAAPHVHFWSAPASLTGVNFTGVTAGGTFGSTGTVPFGFQTSSELWNPNPGAGASVQTAVEGFNLTGHTHTVTPALTYGVFEGAVATGVMITFDGVAGTGLLTGPFNTDQIDLDVTSQISALVDGLWHNIALTPTGLGRITAMLRLEYFSAVVQH